MKKFLIAIALAACSGLAGTGSSALAQNQNPPPPTAQSVGDAGITANGVIGEVAAVDATAKTMFVKTDAGSVVIVTLNDATSYMRLPPGESTMTKATKVALADVGAGDRVFARGKVADDRKSMVARIVILNTKSDIEQKQEAERAEWKRRGVVGEIAALNPETKEITLKSRGAPGGGQPVVITANAVTVKFRRYAPDSVKFSDAKPSSFGELKVGDQLRAKGEKSADGTRFNPEEIVTGSFRTVVGTVTAVNAAAKEIKINTLQGNQPLTIVVSKDSMLKRVPAEFASMMMQRPGGGATPGGAPAAGGGAPAGGAAGAAGATPGGAQGGVVRRMGGDMQEMLERLPAATLDELKPGSMIVFSTTGTGAERVTAIQLVAGIEPIVAMMQARAGAGGRGPSGGAGGGGGAGLNFGFGIGQP